MYMNHKMIKLQSDAIPDINKNENYKHNGRRNFLVRWDK